MPRLHLLVKINKIRFAVYTHCSVSDVTFIEVIFLNGINDSLVHGSKFFCKYWYWKFLHEFEIIVNISIWKNIFVFEFVWAINIHHDLNWIKQLIQILIYTFSYREVICELLQICNVKKLIANFWRFSLKFSQFRQIMQMLVNFTINDKTWKNLPNFSKAI